MTNNRKLPSFEEYMEIIEDSIEKLKEERSQKLLGRVNGVYLLDRAERDFDSLVIIGDIHGDYTSLRYILNNIEKKLLDKKLLFIALGDYIDRGSFNEQILSLTALLKFKNRYPMQVILLRGNHEPPKGLEPYPHDFPYALVSVYGMEKGKEAYNKTRHLFDELPYAVIIKGFALLVHGGPPTFNLNEEVDVYLGYSTWPPDINVLTEILWNDPYETDLERIPSPRGAGFLWGIPVTLNVLNKLQVKYIIRGHEPSDLGYKLNHNGKVITLFSRLGPPYYNKKAAFIYCSDLKKLKDNPLSCIITFG